MIDSAEAPREGPGEQDRRYDFDVLAGQRVHTAMWERRITQLALAEHLHIGRSTLGNKLLGRRPWSLHEITAVAQHLNLSVAYLAGEIDDPLPWRAAQQPATTQEPRIPSPEDPSR